ncbi:MAG: DUF2306 domain-containing protein [Vicinamibacterales bacterium]
MVKPTRHSRTTRGLLVPSLLLALGIVPTVAGVVRLALLYSGTTPIEDARFAEQPVVAVLHVLTVIPYALLGALQFSPALRRQGWHRAAGIALVPLGFAAALTGLWMTLSYPTAPGDGPAVFAMRLVVGLAVITFLTLGVRSVATRDFAMHGAWMLRAYALAMGAGTHVLTHLPWFIFVDDSPSGAPRAVMMAAGWIINAVVAEAVIRTKVVHRVPALQPRHS